MVMIKTIVAKKTDDDSSNSFILDKVVELSSYLAEKEQQRSEDLTPPQPKHTRLYKRRKTEVMVHLVCVKKK
jgi:hypothetical protein